MRTSKIPYSHIKHYFIEKVTVKTFGPIYNSVCSEFNKIKKKKKPLKFSNFYLLISIWYKTKINNSSNKICHNRFSSYPGNLKNNLFLKFHSNSQSFELSVRKENCIILMPIFVSFIILISTMEWTREKKNLFFLCTKI